MDKFLVLRYNKTKNSGFIAYFADTKEDADKMAENEIEWCDDDDMMIVVEVVTTLEIKESEE